MKKIKILEVSEVDLIGKRFNGYDMISDLDSKLFDIKQAVLTKKSNNDSVISIMKTNGEYIIMDYINKLEKELSIKNVLSITTPNLLQLKEYKEADIVHFHQFHNANLSIPALRKISKEKKVIITLHDPWFLTGHCVHYYNCDKWKTGCVNCSNLKLYFPTKHDRCHDMWNLKKSVFESIDVDIVVSSDWMINSLKKSPIFIDKRIHKIPFGINNNKFRSVTKQKARKHYSISDDSFVFFMRAQHEFKGTKYILEALKNLEVKKKNIVILTCEVPHLLDEVKNKYKVIDLGMINDKEMIYAMNACDVFLMPSTAESFGLMAIEAMACAKPVIVFDNTALPSVTHAPKCGYLVKDRDSIDLMNKMKYVIENPKDVEKRGRLALSIVKKEYTLDIYNKKIKDLYIKVSKCKKRNSIYNPKIKENKNINQFKFILNDLTVMIFGTKHEIVNEMLYQLKGIKRIKKYLFDFSDKNIQDLIIDYSIKLKKLFDKYNFGDLDDRKKTRIEKSIYLLKNNPKMIKYILKKRKYNL